MKKTQKLEVVFLIKNHGGWQAEGQAEGRPKLAGWGGSFLMFYNNAGTLGADFISVCLETRWLGQNRGFYEPEPYCIVTDLLYDCRPVLFPTR